MFAEKPDEKKDHAINYRAANQIQFTYKTLGLRWDLNPGPPR